MHQSDRAGKTTMALLEMRTKPWRGLIPPKQVEMKKKVVM